MVSHSLFNVRFFLNAWKLRFKNKNVCVFVHFLFFLCFTYLYLMTSYPRGNLAMLIRRVIDYLDDARAYVSQCALHKRENDEQWVLHFHWLQYKTELCSKLLSKTYLPSHQGGYVAVPSSGSLFKLCRPMYKKPWHRR